MLLCGIFICIAGIVVYSFFTLIRASRPITVICDKSFTKKTEDSIRCAVIQGINEKKTITDILTTLQKIAPTISDVIIRYHPHTTYTKVVCEYPWIMVKQPPHNHWIITPQGTYSDQKIYEQWMLKNLPSITIESPHFTYQEKNHLYLWASQIPQDILESHSIVWKRPTHITLYDPKKPLRKIITNIETKITPQLQKKLSIVDLKHTPKKNNLSWKADVRFDNQIVLSSINNQRRGI